MQFKTIIEEAIAKAEKVRCSEREFKIGLAVMLYILHERVEIEEIDPQDPEVLAQLE